MKKAKILRLSKMFMLAFYGATVVSAGINLKIWQYWVLLALVIGISVVSLYQGRMEAENQ